MELFESYLPYSDYKELGGELPEDAFAKLERKAQRYLDSFTFDRIKKLTVIPDEVKEVLTEYISRLDDYNKQAANGDVLTQYSNGVEQFSYQRKTENTFKKELSQIAVDWLPSYLTNRLVNFDVDRYLQRDDNNTQQAETNG